MSEKNCLFILVAASSSGKGKLMNTLESEGIWKTVPKYSTRNNRGPDDDVVKIEKAKNHEERIQYLKEICGGGSGVVYYKYENFYGFKYDEIITALRDSHVVIVLSDFIFIKRIKEHIELKDRTKVIYIASPVDERVLLKRYKERENIKLAEESDKDDRDEQTIQKIYNLCLVLSSASRLKYLNTIEDILPLLNEEWNKYVPYFDTIKARSLNIRMLYNRYIDHIVDIDYTILNFYEIEDMYAQARNIIANTKYHEKKRKPPVFMVCAAVSSGKGTLMEIVGDMGKIYDNIAITTKYAKREKKGVPEGRDGMIPIGPDGNFDDHITPATQWKWKFHGVEYAVDRQEINDNIEKGLAQIFISNMGQIQQAKQYYPDNVVVLYLHAAHATATEDHIKQKRKRQVMRKNGIKKDFIDTDTKTVDEEFDKFIQSNRSAKNEYECLVKTDISEIEEVFRDYVRNIDNIDHVLLNTGTREDLVDQMLYLITYYAG